MWYRSSPERRFAGVACRRASIRSVADANEARPVVRALAAAVVRRTPTVHASAVSAIGRAAVALSPIEDLRAANASEIVATADVRGRVATTSEAVALGHAATIERSVRDASPETR